MRALTYNEGFWTPVQPGQQRWECIAQDGPVHRRDNEDGSCFEWIDIKVIGWVVG